MYWLNLSATVTLPDLTMSTSSINFETVQCGRCKVITIRIRNPYKIKSVKYILKYYVMFALGVSGLQ